MGLKQGNAKFPCLLCLWDRTAKIDQYEKHLWPPRTNEHKKKQFSAVEPALVDPAAIIPPPLHIKICLITQIMKHIYK